MPLTIIIAWAAEAFKAGSGRATSKFADSPLGSALSVSVLQPVDSSENAPNPLQKLQQPLHNTLPACSYREVLRTSRIFTWPDNKGNSWCALRGYVPWLACPLAVLNCNEYIPSWATAPWTISNNQTVLILSCTCAGKMSLLQVLVRNLRRPKASRTRRWCAMLSDYGTAPALPMAAMPNPRSFEAFPDASLVCSCRLPSWL